MLGKWIYAALFTERFQTVATWGEFCAKAAPVMSWGTAHQRRPPWLLHWSQESEFTAELLHSFKTEIAIDGHPNAQLAFRNTLGEFQRAQHCRVITRGEILSQLASFIIKCCEKPSTRWWETLDLPTPRSLCSAPESPGSSLVSL